MRWFFEGRNGIDLICVGLIFAFGVGVGQLAAWQRRMCDVAGVSAEPGCFVLSACGATGRPVC